jgi:hypothetical protein
MAVNSVFAEWETNEAPILLASEAGTAQREDTYMETIKVKALSQAMAPLEPTAPTHQI